MTDTDLSALREAVAKATPGPWQVVEDSHPCYFGSPHMERRIFTTWDHPQLKGPDGVVNASVGIGAEKGGPARHMVQISAADAAYIAAANPAAIAALLDRLERRTALLREARDSVDAEAQNLRAAYGHQLMHKQKPVIDLMARIEAELAGGQGQPHHYRRDEMNRRVVCAAIRAEDGSLLLGIRHYSRDMHEQIHQRSDGQKFVHRHGDDQGFVDQHCVYMTRKEAFDVARDADQINYPDACDFKAWELFSEGLY